MEDRAMKISNEKIIESLRVIKEVCEVNLDKRCIKCPFSTKEGCGIIKYSPDSWEIVGYEKFQALR